MFTDKSFDELTKGLSGEEVSTIRKGVLVKGMTKRTVLISYGPPPEHRTPSLELNQWVYWRNLRKTKEICFDDNEKATQYDSLN